MYRWSAHATQRAQERFPNVDIEAAISVARRPRRKIRPIINRQRPGHKHEVFSKSGKYVIYNDYEHIVFIIAAYPQPTVVTVFEYYPPVNDNKT